MFYDCEMIVATIGLGRKQSNRVISPQSTPLTLHPPTAPLDGSTLMPRLSMERPITTPLLCRRYRLRPKTRRYRHHLLRPPLSYRRLTTIFPSAPRQPQATSVKTLSVNQVTSRNAVQTCVNGFILINCNDY